MSTDELNAACRRRDAALPRLNAIHIIELIERRFFRQNHEPEAAP